ncbi:MAG: DNA polymerase III subunit delta [Bacilli bacterium]|jgi:DNA polymerase-3 subunit delta|nr:DNA polymerase III subunit delta [Bacilli bacterium]MCH4201678.1 DNA polymerase III subunit delta [Bacilli bacterium]MCH4235260.1 DNA polymerase III subunit delta [Bacilli bacterium]
MIYIIFGKEPLLIRNTVKKTMISLIKEPNSFNYSQLEAGDTSLEQLLDEIETNSLTGEQKVIVYNHADFLKDAKKIDADVLDRFQSFFADEGSLNSLIFTVIGESINKKNPLISILPKSVKVLELQTITSATWPELVRRTFEKNGAIIDDDARDELLQRVNNNVSSFVNEANKLSTYTSHVRLEDVEMLVPRPLEEKSYLLTSYLLQKRLKPALELVEDLMMQNLQPVVLISTLSNQLRMFSLVAYQKENNIPESQIASDLKLHPYRLKMILKDLGRRTSKDILNILDHLFLLDYKIKSGTIDAKEGFDFFLIESC